MLRYFKFGSSFKLRWCQSRDLFRSQIPVTTGGFQLPVCCIQSSYLTHKTLLWSLQFAIQINLEQQIIADFRRFLQISDICFQSWDIDFFWASVLINLSLFWTGNFQNFCYETAVKWVDTGPIMDHICLFSVLSCIILLLLMGDAHPYSKKLQKICYNLIFLTKNSLKWIITGAKEAPRKGLMCSSTNLNIFWELLVFVMESCARNIEK